MADKSARDAAIRNASRRVNSRYAGFLKRCEAHGRDPLEETERGLRVLRNDESRLKGRPS